MLGFLGEGGLSVGFFEGGKGIMFWVFEDEKDFRIFVE